MKDTKNKYMAFAISGLFVILIGILAFVDHSPRYQRFAAHNLGPFDTLTTFMGYAESEEAFAHYTDIVFSRLEELHRYFDIFNEYEGINNLYTVNANAGIAPVVVSQDIIDLLLAAREAYEITDGMTNAAMGSVLRIWHEYRGHGAANPDYAVLPSLEALTAAAGLMDISRVIIDEAASTVFLEEHGMSLDVGSIAKGFAAGLVMEAAAQAGMENMLISAGGHVVAMGAPPGRDAWEAGIANPMFDADDPHAPAFGDLVFVSNGSVSTSSGDIRFFTVDGQSLGHIIDPTTLHPAQRFLQVTVIHKESWMADVLSTALFILPLEEGYALAERTGAHGMWIDIDGVHTVSGLYIPNQNNDNWEKHWLAIQLADCELPLPLTPGVFIGTDSGGHYGDVSVAVTISFGGVITAIEPIDSDEAAQFADPSFEQLAENVMTAQRPRMDAYTGATQPSHAFLNAIWHALEQSIALGPGGG